MYRLQPQLKAIGVPQAWTRSRGDGVVLALLGLDGVDPEHEDLLGRILPGLDYTDGDAWPDPGAHDTWAAGIAVAVTNNGKGVASVAPEALLMPVRAPEAYAIRWAIDHGARVLFFEYGTISFQEFTGAGRVAETFTGDFDTALKAAVRYAHERGAVVLGAAGNFGLPGCVHPSLTKGIVCVGAVDDSPLGLPIDTTGQRAFYSNFGARVDLMAPGRALSTSFDPNQPTAHDRYAQAGGTSAAVAYAAGVAALLLSAGASNEEAVRVMKCTADDLGQQGPDFVYGHGRLNAARAMAALGTGITCPAPPRDLLEAAGVPDP